MTGQFTNILCKHGLELSRSVADWIRGMSATFEWVLTNKETFDNIGTYLHGDDRFRVLISGFSKNIWSFHLLDRALTIGLYTSWACRTPSETLSEIMGHSPRSRMSDFSYAQYLSDDSPRRLSPRSGASGVSHACITFPDWQYTYRWRQEDDAFSPRSYSS